jgi:hypothetical protein
MTEPTPATSRGNYWCAALAAVTGIYFLTLGSGLLHIPGGKANLHGPQWLVLCVGLAFFLASIAVVIQTLGHANNAGDLPAGTPRWMGVVQYLIGFAIFACFGAIMSWVAFGPGKRHFSTTFWFIKTPGNETVGRIAFGFVAVVMWLGMSAILASGIRKFFDDHGKPRMG